MKPMLSWRTLMETRFEQRTKIKTPTLVAVVVGLHVVAVGSIVFIQGCETAGRRQPVDPPPAVVMPDPEPQEARPVVHRPPIQPPPATTTRPPVATPAPSPAAQTYTVRRGDSLSQIARRHGVDAATLMDLNNISNPDLIRVDQVLLLPHGARTQADTAAPARPAAPTRPTPAAGDRTYVVQTGDVLSRIANRHGVTQADLMAANNITNPNRIMVGQTLIIPGGSRSPAQTPAQTPPAATTPAPREPRPVATPPARVPEPVAPVVAPAPVPAPVDPGTPASAVEPFVYTVRANDTIAGLARDFGVLEEEILRLNNLQAGATLRPGQSLEIPGF